MSLHSQGSRELGSIFQVVATAAPGRTFDELRSCRRIRLVAGDARYRRRTRARPPCRRRHRSSIGCRRLGGFGGRADQLNAYNVYCGTPDYFEQDLRALFAPVTRSDIAARRARSGSGARSLLSVVPRDARAHAFVGLRASIVQARDGQPSPAPPLPGPPTPLHFPVH